PLLAALVLAIGSILGCATMVWATPSLAHPGAQPDVQPDPDLLEEISRAWAEDPVFVSDRAGALTADRAEQISDRIVGWRDDVFIAVLPASAFEDLPGNSDPQKAVGF